MSNLFEISFLFLLHYYGHTTACILEITNMNVFPRDTWLKY